MTTHAFHIPEHSITWKFILFNIVGAGSNINCQLFNCHMKQNARSNRHCTCKCKFAYEFESHCGILPVKIGIYEPT